MYQNNNLNRPLVLPNPASDPSIAFLVSQQLLELKTSDVNNSLIHLYRGELSRQINYRNRLDRSTQWAVTIASTLTVLSFAYETVPGYLHALIAFFVCIFLVLETRRYMYYSVVKYRVRQLELGYYGKYILGPKYQPWSAIQPQYIPPSQTVQSTLLTQTQSEANGHVIDMPTSAASSETPRSLLPLSDRRYSVALSDPHENPNVWLPKLLASIQHPHITITFFQAMCVRLYRVYWGLLLGVYIGWVMKVSILDDWSHNVLPASLIGGVCALITCFIYVIFPVTQRSRSLFWQRLYWSDSEYMARMDVDV